MSEGGMPKAPAKNFFLDRRITKYLPWTMVNIKRNCICLITFLNICMVKYHLKFRCLVIYKFSFFYCPYTLVMRRGRVSKSNPFGGIEFLSRKIAPHYHTSWYGTLKPLVSLWPVLFRTYRAIRFCNWDCILEISPDRFRSVYQAKSPGKRT